MSALKLLFLGDSVTDSHHSTHQDPYGCGYVNMIYHELLCTYPCEELKIVNSGYNGHRSKDLLNRIVSLLEEEYSHIFILIGVNDSWRKFDQNDETTADHYQENLKKLLRMIQQNSKAKIILMSPFVLKVNAMTNHIYHDLKEKQKRMKRLALQNNLVFLDLQKVFTMAARKHKKLDLTHDGIHPTILGHAMIASSIIKEIF